MGWFEFEIFGDKGVQLPDPNWGAALWALLIAAIWFWVGLQFWNMRAAGWQFGVFISLFTLIWGFFALLFGSTVHVRDDPDAPGPHHLRLPDWPGVREAFAKSEMDRLTPSRGPPTSSSQRPTPRPGRPRPRACSLLRVDRTTDAGRDPRPAFRVRRLPLATMAAWGP